MSGPDGLEERTACADEALEAAFEQMDIDEAEADFFDEPFELCMGRAHWETHLLGTVCEFCVTLSTIPMIAVMPVKVVL